MGWFQTASRQSLLSPIFKIKNNRYWKQQQLKNVNNNKTFPRSHISLHLLPYLSTISIAKIFKRNQQYLTSLPFSSRSLIRLSFHSSCTTKTVIVKNFHSTSSKALNPHFILLLNSTCVYHFLLLENFFAFGFQEISAPWLFFYFIPSLCQASLWNSPFSEPQKMKCHTTQNLAVLFSI